MLPKIQMEPCENFQKLDAHMLSHWFSVIGFFWTAVCLIGIHDDDMA